MIGAEWLVIGLIIVIVFVVMKIANKKQEVAVRMVLFLFLFFMLTAGYVYVANDIDLTSADGILYAGKAYWVWVTTIAHNLIDVSGYAIKQDWAINTSAFSTNLSK